MIPTKKNLFNQPLFFSTQHYRDAV